MDVRGAAGSSHSSASGTGSKRQGLTARQLNNKLLVWFSIVTLLGVLAYYVRQHAHLERIAHHYHLHHLGNATHSEHHRHLPHEGEDDGAGASVQQTGRGASARLLAQRSAERYDELYSGDVALESAKWRPLLLRKCEPGMPTYFAPCLATLNGSTLVYAEEVVYPDFEAALPGFLEQADAEAWIQANFGQAVNGQTMHNKRVLVDLKQGTVVWLGLRGQNLVHGDVRYTDDMMPRTWVGASDHCLGHMYPHQKFPALPAASLELPAQLIVDDAVVFRTPDSQRYQHFLDHTVKVLVQSHHLITKNTTLLLGTGLANKQTIVQKMWEWFPDVVSKAQLATAASQVAGVRRLLDSCRCPYVHPYLFIRLQELVLGPEAPRVPLEQRKVLMYYSRTVEDGTRANPGRQIENEQELLAAIRKLLEERGRGETLQVHDPSKFPDPLQYARWINSNVAGIIGPHGGGLCNVKWLAFDSLVLEFQPRTWINAHFYEESAGHGLNYWVSVEGVADPVKMNMQPSIPKVLDLLRQELGKAPARGPLLRHHYDWPNALEPLRTSSARHFADIKSKCCNIPGDSGISFLRFDPKQQQQQPK